MLFLKTCIYCVLLKNNIPINGLKHRNEYTSDEVSLET